MKIKHKSEPVTKLDRPMTKSEQLRHLREMKANKLSMLQEKKQKKAGGKKSGRGR